MMMPIVGSYVNIGLAILEKAYRLIKISIKSHIGPSLHLLCLDKNLSIFIDQKCGLPHYALLSGLKQTSEVLGYLFETLQDSN